MLMRPDPKSRSRTVSAREKLKFAIEPLFVTAPEYPVLFKEFAAEVGPGKHCPFDYDWNNALQQNIAGNLQVLTARTEDDELVGFVFNLIGFPQKYKRTLHGQLDMIWLRPDYRVGWAGVEMIKANEAHLKALGVKRILAAQALRYRNHSGLKLKVLFEYMRFKPLEVVWQKFL